MADGGRERSKGLPAKGDRTYLLKRAFGGRQCPLRQEQQKQRASRASVAFSCSCAAPDRTVDDGASRPASVPAFIVKGMENCAAATLKRAIIKFFSSSASSTDRRGAIHTDIPPSSHHVLAESHSLACLSTLILKRYLSIASSFRACVPLCLLFSAARLPCPAFPNS